jgi:hypothetical protein
MQAGNIFRSRSGITWPFVPLLCTAPYAAQLSKTAMLFFDNGLEDEERSKQRIFQKLFPIYSIYDKKECSANSFRGHFDYTVINNSAGTSSTATNPGNP